MSPLACATRLTRPVKGAAGFAPGPASAAAMRRAASSSWMSPGSRRAAITSWTCASRKAWDVGRREHAAFLQDRLSGAQRVRQDRALRFGRRLSDRISFRFPRPACGERIEVRGLRRHRRRAARRSFRQGSRRRSRPASGADAQAHRAMDARDRFIGNTGALHAVDARELGFPRAEAADIEGG